MCGRVGAGPDEGQGEERRLRWAECQGRLREWPNPAGGAAPETTLPRGNDLVGSREIHGGLAGESWSEKYLGALGALGARGPRPRLLHK